MFEAGSWFWRWLAEQPAFIEVGVGMSFVLLLAPAVLVTVAVVATRVEGVVARIVVQFLNSGGRAAVMASADSKLGLVE